MIWKLFHKLFGTLSFPIYVNVGEKVKCTPWNNLALETYYWHPLALNKDNFLNRETSWNDYDTVTTKFQPVPAKQPLCFNHLSYSDFWQIKNTYPYNSCQQGSNVFCTVVNNTHNHHALSHVFTPTMSNFGDINSE